MAALCISKSSLPHTQKKTALYVVKWGLGKFCINKSMLSSPLTDAVKKQTNIKSKNTGIYHIELQMFREKQADYLKSKWTSIKFIFG